MRTTVKELRNLIFDCLVNEGILKCPDCGLTLTMEKKFCTRCGKQVKCDKCGNLLRPGSHFCTKCSNQISKVIARHVDGLKVGDVIVHPKFGKFVKILKIIPGYQQRMIFFKALPPFQLQDSQKVWLLV